MNDKELLNLAAKAAGVVWIDEAFDYDNFGRMMLDFGQGTQEWNPLADSNDAFRLAVKLWIDISFPPYMKHERPVVHAGKYWDNSDGCWYPHEELRGTDPYAATRRAIVRAAAEIGREMK